MDVFALRDALITDYEKYATSFVNIADERIRERVEDRLKEGRLWPDPMIQLNPAFEPGATIDALCDEGVLHDECRRIFQVSKTPESATPDGRPLRLHRHQEDAIRTAKTGANYVLTTGTGSGKSLAYIVPIVDRVLRNGSGKGIQAIIVYPMNALANSQQHELAKFLEAGYPAGRPPVRVRRYTGQESDADRQAIIADPPDVILTNYVMLELLLTRVYERQLVEAARGLRFLVLDELHTYRGRQGADVAFLIRRVREACEATELQVVGTSATIAGAETFADQQTEVAQIASTLFGSAVDPSHVIGETLRRSTVPADPEDTEFVRELTARLRSGTPPPQDHASFVADPLARWVEHTFGIGEENGAVPPARLKRRTPRAVRGAGGAAAELAALTGVDEERCREALEEMLLAGYEVHDPDTDFPVFAFRLHQFLSKGDTVYATPEPEDVRHVTLDRQQFVPGDRNRVLLPLAFCRECGQEYYTVSLVTDDDGASRFVARDPAERLVEAGEAGYLYISTRNPWPLDTAEEMARLPEDMLDLTGATPHIKSSQKKYRPTRVSVRSDGTVSNEGREVVHVRMPFRFCLNCGVTYGARQRSEFAKLATLSSEGRSTATTILGLSAIRRLRDDISLPVRARKLLSFIDNRQDAALQSGHFNDFVQIGLLRSALWKAAKDAGPGGLGHDELAQRVFTALDLPFESYASNPDARYGAREQTKRALRDVIGYLIYQDQLRGWRVTQPNLEQCGLLRIEYASLAELCATEQDWSDAHAALAQADPETREAVSRTLLDHLRRELAIKVSYLNPWDQEQLTNRSRQDLVGAWAVDEADRLETAKIVRPRAKRNSDRNEWAVYLSPRGVFSQYLRRQATFPNGPTGLTTDDAAEITAQLLERLTRAGITERVADPKDAGDSPAYQINAAALRWCAGDGTTPHHDLLRTIRISGTPAPPNEFFVDFYKETAPRLTQITSAEHTAQVEYEDRLTREELFRKAELPVLFCSPTMELGVDIAELNCVNMRNVPPTPANYAQRSGRAGRSGQPALVYTYCTSGSPHDQWFFRRPGDMVAGAVSPPRMDLANEDLVRSHVHAIWLRESGLSLGRSLVEVLDVAEPENLPLREAIRDALADSSARARAQVIAGKVLAGLETVFDEAGWWHDAWLADTLAHVDSSFEAACARWRDLYRSAWHQRETQHAIQFDHSRSPQDRKTATRLRAEAESQLRVLEGEDEAYISDFYSYRYFAAEGFLPGYNFPRLPLAAYIPARKGPRHDRDDFVQRPRFLALTEFGPRTLIYHEGARYRVTKVILPVHDVGMGEAGLPTSTVKICDGCGYLHDVSGKETVDKCVHCDRHLPSPMRSLFRMQNVSTRRADRISSDEEERRRIGYEVKTVLRFAERNNKPSCRRAHAVQGDETLLRLTYGQAATVWRINLGWKHRRNKDQHGFGLDTERGTWQTDEALKDEDPQDPSEFSKAHLARVVPYVEDTRNCLLLEPASELDTTQMASLQAAFANAIQFAFQLEEREIGADALPDSDNRRIILLYEASEGGAGVLRRLVDDPKALSRVAATALELCHFHPDTAQDRGGPPGASEPCEAACYDCLLDYTNQRDHRLLDRHSIVDLLVELRDAAVETSPGPLSPEEHFQHMLNLCQSGLERDWLTRLRERRLRLPTSAQEYIESANVRPDFLYKKPDGGAFTAVYIDGPHHDGADRRAQDREDEDRLMNAGWHVVRFPHAADWDEILARHSDIFGEAR